MASILRVNTLTDASSNNSVAMSVVAGGSAKVTSSTNAAGTTINGSTNVSSLTDSATGKQVLNLSSSFANTNYIPICGVGNKDDGNARDTMIRSVATGSYATNIFSTISSAFSDDATSSTAHGDLA